MPKFELPDYLAQMKKEGKWDTYLSRAYKMGFTHQGYAERSILIASDILRFAPDSGACYLWNGKYWQHAGEKHLRAKTAMARILPVIIEEGKALRAKEKAEKAKNTEEKKPGRPPKTRGDKHRDWIQRIMDSPGYMRGVVDKLAEMGVFTMEETDIDDGRDYLNTPAGVIDLNTGEILPHDKKYHALGITRIAPVISEDFKPFLGHIDPTTLVDLVQSRFPLHYKLLSDAFVVESESSDTAIQRIAAMVLNLADHLNGRTELQRFYLWKGEGANGKGVLARLMENYLGDYYIVADPGTFMDKGSRGGNDTNLDMSRFMRARMVVITEAKRGGRIDAAKIKAVTGGDTVTYRRHYEGYGSYKPQFYPVLNLNHRLHLDEYGYAMRRRVFFTNFPNSMKDRPGEIIRDFDRQILEAEGAEFMGLLCCLSLAQEKGLYTLPDFLRVETQDYVNADSVLHGFIQRYTQTCPYLPGGKANVATQGRKMFRAVLKYCEHYGHARFSYEVFKETWNSLDGITKIVEGRYTGSDYGEHNRRRWDLIPNTYLRKEAEDELGVEPDYIPSDSDKTGDNIPF